MTDPSGLEVRYQLPAGCNALPFLQQGGEAEIAHANWKSTDQCGTATGSALVRTDATCTSLRFRVPATVSFRGYPSAFPMGVEEGIYLHTSRYATTANCGEVRYQFNAPGSVVVAGHAHARQASTDAGTGSDTPVLLTMQPLKPSNGQVRYFDSRLSLQAQAQIAEVADGTATYLRKRLPSVPYTPPAMAASLASAPGTANVGGNGGDLMRLIFFNWPDQPGPEERRKMSLLVAHEMSHRFQLRDALDNYPAGRLIHEGGAEFLRWMASIENGWITPDDAGKELDESLARCMVHTGQSSWAGLPSRYVSGNTLEYACGLPLYVYSLADRQGSETVWGRIDGFYRALRNGRQPDFGTAIECGSVPNCQPQWLPLLTGSQGAMTDHWKRLLESSGLARPGQPSPRTNKEILLKAVGQLMEDDCGGHKSLMPTLDGIVILGSGACRTLRTRMEIVSIEGHPSNGDPKAALSMAQACTGRKLVHLKFSDQTTVEVPCQRSYRAPTQFYAADIAKLFTRLK
jgi:hypothetical protein